MLIRKDKYNATKQELRLVEVESTKSYTAITHKEVIDLVDDLCKQFGIDIISEQFYSTEEGKIAEGHYTFGFTDGEMSLQFVWQNSTNKKVSFKCALGISVAVCTNGSVWGDLGAFKRIHTGQADTKAYDEIVQMLSKAEQTFNEYVKLKDDLKSIHVEPDMAYSLCGIMFFKKMISSTQINIIRDEYEKPSFEYNAEGTVWELWQHITHSFKAVSPRNYLTNQIKVGQFLNKSFFSYEEADWEYVTDTEA